MLNTNSRFQWQDIGDIKTGRPNLGQFVDVAIYRLFQNTMRDVLNRKIGAANTNEIFNDAGKLAGSEFCKNVLNPDLKFYEFIAVLQKKLKDFNIGILRIEKADLENNGLTLTVAEGLACSGLSVSRESMCKFDEGFIEGILNTYTNQTFAVKEIDCWALGGKARKFLATLTEASPYVTEIDRH
jgi:predicted hydrocarbon binding protein